MLTAQREMLLANKLATFGEVALSLAHELRQPLTALKGMAQAVMRNPHDEEILADFQLVVPRELDRLVRLLENLLKFGQLSEERFELVEPNQLLQSATKLFTKRCQSGQIKVVEKLGDLPLVQADPDQLSQVFINLIVNAIQAMPEGGELKLITGVKGPGIFMEIIDTGVGIAEQAIEKIFKPFYSSKKDGLGLGLALVEKMVSSHHGRLTVESQVGEGTRFIVCLPLRQPGPILVSTQDRNVTFLPK